MQPRPGEAGCGRIEHGPASTSTGGQSSLWLLNWWLVLSGYYSLFVGFFVATFCSCLAYLPSHEGQHGNLSGRKKKWRWIDTSVGAITLIPLATSYILLKVTHMKHHAYTNDPLRDVDINSSGAHWEEPKAMEALRPYMIERGIEGAEDIPEHLRFNPLISP